MDQASKTQHTLESIARCCVTIALLLSPWLLGGAEPWAYYVTGLFVGTGLLIWLGSLLCATKIRLRAPGVTAALVLLTALVALQEVPLPDAFLRAPGDAGIVDSTTTDHLSPGALASDIISEARPILSQIQNRYDAVTHLDPGDIPFTLSVAPRATHRSLYLWTLYFGAFLVMANTIRDWSSLRRITSMLVVMSFVMAIISVAHKLSGESAILWIHEPKYGGLIFGPFTNRNHYAAYMNMNIGIALGTLLSTRQLIDVTAWPDWRDRLSWLSSRSASRLALCACMILAMAGSVCVSLSRGAMLSLIVSTILLGFIVRRSRKDLRRFRYGVLGLTLILFALALLLAGGKTIDRLSTLAEIARNPGADLRMIVSMDTLRIFTVFPVLGSGFGTFRYIYTMFQTPSLERRWLHAHNDWAQLLSEGGLVIALIFIFAMVLWVLEIRRHLPSASNRARMMSIGLLLGIATITFHSFIDYSLHKPANALLAAALAGMVVSAVRLRRRGSSRERPRQPARMSQAAHRILASIAFISVACLLYSQRTSFRGELAFSRFQYQHRIAVQATTAETLETAVMAAYREADIVIRCTRDNPDALKEVTAILLQYSVSPALNRSLRIRLTEAASAAATLAAAGAPSDYLAWLWMARTQTARGSWDEADLCLQRARELARHHKQVRMFRAPEDDGEEQEVAGRGEQIP
jgi:O-antigen ligase